MKQANMVLNFIIGLIIMGLLVGVIVWGIIPIINGGYEDAASVKSCNYVGQEGYCAIAKETKAGWECIQFSCDGGYCCYCTDVNVCFGGVMFMNFAGGTEPMELRFENKPTGSHLSLETGTLESSKTLDANGGLSNNRLFSIRYVPTSDEKTCELVISEDAKVITGANTMSFDEQDCVDKKDFVSLSKGIKFNELADTTGDEICVETTDNTCKVYFILKTNGAIKDSFEVYFER